MDVRGAGGREQPPPAGQTPPPELQLCFMVQAKNTAISVTAIETGVAKKNKSKPLPIQT